MKSDVLDAHTFPQRAVAQAISSPSKKSSPNPTYIDRRPETLIQRKLQVLAEQSPTVRHAAGWQYTANQLPIQRQVFIKDSSKKGKKAQKKLASAAEVEDWVFQNIGKKESEGYAATNANLVAFCANPGLSIELDTAHPKGSFSSLRMMVLAAPAPHNYPNLDAMDEGKTFDIQDRMNHPVRSKIPSAEEADERFSPAELEEWNRFLDSFDRNWNHLNGVMKEAGKTDHEVLPRMVSLIRSQYESRNPVYVGIGASADVIIEFLRQSNTKQPIATIPISSVKLDRWEEAAEAEQQKAAAYLARSLGKWWTENIDLVLLDVTEEGDTLIVLKDIIEANDEANDVDREVITASLSATATFPDTDEPETFQDTDIEILKTADRSVNELMRNRFYFQKISGYKTIVGRVYDKVNTFDRILSGEINIPQGYNRDAHLRIIEFVQFVRSRASKTPAPRKLTKADRNQEYLLAAL